VPGAAAVRPVETAVLGVAVVAVAAVGAVRCQEVVTETTVGALTYPPVQTYTTSP
jgi:hypothetical protein